MYLKCKIAAAENTQYWSAGDVVYLNTDGDHFIFNVGADSTHITYQQNGTLAVYEKAIHGVDTSSDSTGSPVAFAAADLVNDWAYITPNNLSLIHI